VAFPQPKQLFVFTATETNFLDVSQITTTDTAGGAITTAETQCVSFITTTPTLTSTNGGGGGTAVAVIAAVVIIAPAVIGIIQTVADGIAGQTVEQVTHDLMSSFSSSGRTIIPGTVEMMARYLIAAFGVGIVGIGAYLEGPAITTDNPTTTTFSMAATTTSSTSKVAITAIMKYPYTNWIDLSAMTLPTQTLLSEVTAVSSASSSSSSTSLPPLPVPTTCGPALPNFNMIAALANANDLCARSDLLINGLGYTYDYETDPMYFILQYAPPWWPNVTTCPPGNLPTSGYPVNHFQAQCLAIYKVLFDGGCKSSSVSYDDS
jgi:hypothetical protein